jgi:high-affinity nickel-transport protein
VRPALTADERRRAAGLAAAVLGLHAAGAVLLIGGGAAGLGLGLTAYTLGLRHAFDADHIGAIDNTTRRLTRAGERPLSVGFWFSLGHSTVVLGLTALVALGASAGRLPVPAAADVIGPVVSGSFLVAIGLLNLGLLRAGDPAPRGLLTRVYGRATRAVRAPWQMYPVGLLFGLGFDTATEVALLATAGAAAAGGLPVYAVLCLPLLFAAGMSLLDTLDGAFMSCAYGWALTEPARKQAYNVAVTGLSVAVALGVGALELLSVAGPHVDLRFAGYAVPGLLAAVWLAALARRRLAGEAAS